MSGERDERDDRDDRDDRLVLAVDLGTGGPKVGFVSVTGRVAWQDLHLVETQWPGGGAALQDAEGWWTTIAGAVRRVLGDGTVDPTSVVAVCITGQWASTVPVDADGRPVGPCIMWQDHRGIRLVKQRIGGPVAGYAPKALATWVRRTAGVPGGNDPIGHMLLLAEHHPDVAAAARWYLEPVDYLAMRFTGIPAASHASMTAWWLTDNRRLDHLAYDGELVALAGADATKLPPLVPTGSVIGPVRPEVAADLGLPAGVQVVTGVPDLHAAIVGSGAVHPGEAHMALSTTSWISLPLTEKKTDVLHGMASVPGLFGGYLLANNQDTAGLALKWLRDNVIDADDQLQPSKGHTFDDLTALAATSPPGAGGVVFTPWLQGERSPVSDTYIRGGFDNVSLRTTRADLVRAVLEGVAFNSAWLLRYVEKYAGQRLDPIRFVGGGAVSDLWCQIHADVFDRTIEQVEEPLHAQLRGAAILAGLALGDVERSEVRGLVPVARTFTPDPGAGDVYRRHLDEVPKLYKARKAIHKRLNRRRM
jgi:xylulokinase